MGTQVMRSASVRKGRSCKKRDGEREILLTECPSFLSYYNTTSVLLCLGITALVCLSVTIFSFQTKVSPGGCEQGRARGPRVYMGLRRGRDLSWVWGYYLEEGCIGLWGGVSAEFAGLSFWPAHC